MKKLYAWLFGIVVVLSSISLSGCDNAAPTNRNSVGEIEKQQALDTLKRLSLIMLDVAQNPENIKLVKHGVELKFDGDENILLSDLINPSESILKQNEVDDFRHVFLREIQEHNLNKRNDLNLDSLFSWIKDNNVQVYWPYTDLWDGKTIPTISYDPMEKEADQNEGFKVVVASDGTTKIETVLVNDEYASNNPVWILNFNEHSRESIQNHRQKRIKKNNNNDLYSRSSSFVKTIFENICFFCYAIARRGKSPLIRW